MQRFTASQIRKILTDSGFPKVSRSFINTIGRNMKRDANGIIDYELEIPGLLRRLESFKERYHETLAKEGMLVEEEYLRIKTNLSTEVFNELRR